MRTPRSQGPGTSLKFSGGGHRPGLGRVDRSGGRGGRSRTRHDDPHSRGRAREGVGVTGKFVRKISPTLPCGSSVTGCVSLYRGGRESGPHVYPTGTPVGVLQPVDVRVEEGPDAGLLRQPEPTSAEDLTRRSRVRGVCSEKLGSTIRPLRSGPHSFCLRDTDPLALSGETTAVFADSSPRPCRGRRSPDPVPPYLTSLSSSKDARSDVLRLSTGPVGTRTRLPSQSTLDTTVEKPSRSHL